MSLSRPVVLGFTRQGKDFVSAAREEEEANRAAGSGAPATPEGYMVGGLSMDEVRTRTIYTYIYILEHSSGLAVVLFFELLTFYTLFFVRTDLLWTILWSPRYFGVFFDFFCPDFIFFLYSCVWFPCIRCFGRLTGGP